MSNYFWPAILATVFCFFPFGILAIVYSIRVDSSLARGDYRVAVQASKSARILCWVSFVFGLAFYVIAVAIFLLTTKEIVQPAP